MGADRFGLTTAPVCVNGIREKREFHDDEIVQKDAGWLNRLIKRRPMFRKLLTLFLFVFPLISWGQFYSISLDTQDPQNQPVIDHLFSGDNTFLRAYIYESGAPLDLSGWSINFYYGWGQYDTNGLVTVTGAISSNRVDFLDATNIFARPYDDYYWAISGKSLSGYTKSFGTGTLKVRYNPSTSTNLYAMMEQVNISWLTNWIGAQVESNRSDIIVLTTGKTDLVTYNAHVAAQANTNAGFETRIISNETFRITTQPATNVSLQTQITSNQNQITDNKVAQANTNAGFESRISSNEVFRITTQPATNANLQAQITSNYTNQNATNAVLQGQITLNLTNQNATNTLLQLQISQNQTNQTATNTVLQNQIAANYTNQNATNAAFEPRIAKGELAWSWGDWSGQGFLTSATNIFTVLYVADRSKLATNIAGLTQGVYTGSLTSVSYTGTTEMVLSRTYVWGYTKIGTDGTSTLSIASQSLSATAPGATSNYFTYTTADTNLILKLDGNGFSICNVSNVYVRQITSGNVHVAGDVNVGGVIRAYGAILTNPAAHIAATGTNVHGLGTMSIQSTSDYYTASATDNLLDTKVATNDAAYLAALTNGTLTKSTSNAFWTDGRMIGIAVRTNYASTSDMAQAQADIAVFETGKVDHVDATYTNAIALSGSALQPGAVGTTTNLSDYNNDVPFATGTPVYVESDPNWAAVSNDVTGNEANGQTAYNWGDHATNDYATGTPIYVESDPNWGTVSNSITEQAGHGETAYGWGDHGTNDYATGTPVYVETDPVWASEKSGYATGTPLYVETYVGTITGATIAASSSDSVVVTGPNAVITWNTNAAGGGGGAGTITNIISSDGSVSISESGGPQPDLSVIGLSHTNLTGWNDDTNYLHLSQSEKDNATNYFVAEFTGGLQATEEGGTATVSAAFGTTAGTVYDGAQGNSVSGQVAVITTNYTPLPSFNSVSGDVAIIKTNYYSLPNGTSASNLAYSASTNAEAARQIATNAQETANAALPKVGGILSGSVTGTVFTANTYNFTNSTVMNCGVLNGTNGAYWTWNGTNYWVLFVP